MLLNYTDIHFLFLRDVERITAGP